MPLKKVAYTKLPAFTLTELLVVLVIIGILILLALPVLMPLISRTRSLEAKQALKHLHSLEKSYFYEHSRYSGGKGKANYRVEIVEAGINSYLLRATAVVDLGICGVVNVTSFTPPAFPIELNSV